jgi:hypothetical protein
MQIDIVGDLSIDGKQSDAECVGARFIAPREWGGATAVAFANIIKLALDKAIDMF